MSVGLKKVKQLIRSLSLDKEQLQSFISKEGNAAAAGILTSLLIDSSRKQTEHLITLIKEMPQDFFEAACREIVLNQSFFYPYKKMLLDAGRDRQSPMSEEVMSAAQTSEAGYTVFMRCLEDRSFSQDNFDKFAELPVPLLVSYFKEYSENILPRLDWLLSYYGRNNNFDEAFLFMAKEIGGIEALRFIDSMLGKKPDKDRAKELKKIRYEIQRTRDEKTKQAKSKSVDQATSNARIYKAWITPYIYGKNLRIDLINYLALTDNYVYCSLQIKNKTILSAEVLMLEEEKSLRDFTNYISQSSRGVLVAVDPSYAMHLVSKSITWHQKKNMPLPQQLEKYMPILVLPYDRKLKNPLANIYDTKEYLNYPFYDEYIAKLYEGEAMFTTWLVPKKVIAAFSEEVESLSKSVIEIPKEQINDRIREVVQKYIDQYWTEAKRKEDAIKLRHMSYYLFMKEKEFLSRLCYAASLKMRQMDMKPSQNAFAELMFAFSYNLFKAYEERAKNKQKIIAPGKSDDKGIILPGR
jgi:hypothetical protein